MSTMNTDISGLQLDALDHLAAEAFDGFIVRKDLVRKFPRQYPVPTYVVEFLLGRYCASTDENEIAEGLADRREATSGTARFARARRSCSSRERARRARSSSSTSSRPASMQRTTPTWPSCRACSSATSGSPTGVVQRATSAC